MGPKHLFLPPPKRTCTDPQTQRAKVEGVLPRLCPRFFSLFADYLRPRLDRRHIRHEQTAKAGHEAFSQVRGRA